MRLELITLAIGGKPFVGDDSVDRWHELHTIIKPTGRVTVMRMTRELVERNKI